MKKKVLTVLTVFAVSCFGSTAIAAEGELPVVKGNIEIYGQARLSVDMIDTDSKTAGADTKLYKVSSNSSRLGFKGTEDLGDGLSAVFQVELGLNFDSSTTKVNTPGADGLPGTADDKTTDIDKITYRNTYAGLSDKGLGALIFGIHDTPYKLATGKLDIFSDTMGDYNAIIGSVNGTVNFDLRQKDEVVYMSPKWGGLQIMASTSTAGGGVETSNGAASNASMYSASVAYNDGPLLISLAHEIHKNGFVSGEPNDTTTGTKAGLGFTFGDTKLGVVYEKINADAADSKFSREAFYIALSQKIGNETIKAAYGNAGDGEDPTETGASQITVGIDHSFSKRTTIYALYTKMKNDAGATYGIGTGGAGGSYVPNAGEDPSALSIGINHSF